MKTVIDVQRFVEESAICDPPPVPRLARGAFSYDAAKSQAAVVGSDIVAFVKGVTEQDREDITNSTLFAQAYAKQRMPTPSSFDEWAAWYCHYFDALSAIGFAVQSRGFEDYEERSDDFEAYKVIIEVASELLAGTPSAVAAMTAALTALQEMALDSSFVTLFDRESRSVNTARFQATLTDRTEGEDLLVSLIAFSLEASSNLVQVLFFKFRTNEVRLRKNSTIATISRSTVASARQALARKLADRAATMIEGFDL